MVKTHRIIFLAFVLLLVSCKKVEERTCFKFKGGSENERTVDIAHDIDSLFLFDDLAYRIIPSVESKVVIRGGENLIPFVSVESGNRCLTIQNKNQCKFLRSYDNQLVVEIYRDTLRYIEYKGSRELKSTDTLRSNELRLLVSEGSGDIDLILKNGYTSAVVADGYGNLTLKGETLIGFLNCNSNSFCEAQAFVTSEKLEVISNTAGEMFVNANHTVFQVGIQRNGNVNYLGDPNSIVLNKNGKGNLVNLN